MRHGEKYICRESTNMQYMRTRQNILKNKCIKCTGPRIVQTELAFCLLFMYYYLLYTLFFFFFSSFSIEGDRSGEVTQIKGVHKQELQGLLSA